MLWSLCAASCSMCCHAASSRSAILVFWPIAKESARSGCVPPFCPPRNPPHALRSLRHLAPYDCALTAREHSCSSHGSAPLSYWLFTSFPHWTPHDRPRPRHFHPHCPPPQSDPTRRVAEIPIHRHPSPLSLPPSPYSLPESFPNHLNSRRPSPPETLKPPFKTQQHFRHGSVQVALSELPRRSATRLAPTFPRLGSSDQRL